jgi:hypothetical protein
MSEIKHQRTKESPFLTVQEAAAYLKLSPNTLNNMRCRGGGPPYRKHGNLVFYHIDDLEAYTASRTYSSTGGTYV